MFKMSSTVTITLSVVLAFIGIVAGGSTSRQLAMDSDNGVKLEDLVETLPKDFVYEMPVHSFSRTILCDNHQGKVLLFNVMTKRITTLSREFIESFIYDLCQLHPRHDSILDRWVQELFDTDGDGHITQAEMHYFNR